MKILAILAPKQQGKDTVTDYIVKNYQFKQYAFANPLKRGLKEMFDFTDEQLWGSDEEKDRIDSRWGISARRMMQIVGTELFQYDIQKYLNKEEIQFKAIGRKIWVHKFKLWFEHEEKLHKQNFIEAKVAGLVNGNIPEFKIIISDARFPHECEFIKELGGEIWKIERPSENKNKKDNHPSETEYQQVKEDRLILNDGSLEDLYKKIELNLVN